MAENIFITGILGQDGAYLAKLALDKGHRVVGGARRSSTMNDWRLRELGIERDVEIVDFELLEENNFSVLTHKQVPANDGGISFGQAAIASQIYLNS